MLLAAEPLDEWAARTFAAWRIGRAGLDDGVAVFIFADDRAIAIEVGYGLEEKLPDATASRIIREVMAPRFRAGDRDGSIEAGADAIITAIEGRPWAGAPAAPVRKRELSWLQWLAGGAAFAVLLILAIKYPRLALALLWMFFSLGRGRGPKGFDAGGGRSGGGGARGGW